MLLGKFFTNLFEKKNYYLLYFYFPIAVYAMELIVKLHCFDVFFNIGLLYTFLFSVVIGVICAAVVNAVSGKAGRILAVVFMLLIILILGVQAVYFTIFKTFTSFSALNMAGDAISDFWKQTLEGIWNTMPTILGLFVPLIVFVLLRKHLVPERRSKLVLLLIPVAIAALIQATAVTAVMSDTSGVMSTKYIYSETFSPLLSIPRFGVLTTTRLDLQTFLPDADDEIMDTFTPSRVETPSPTFTASPIPTGDPSGEPTGTMGPTPTPIVYMENALDIDFDALIAGTDNSVIKNMHQYFASLAPTMENEYTGMFEGKNLIWIVAEGFSTLALEESCLPTLSKMAQEGFVFNNFYNPIWYYSTSDGEFSTLTGLIPDSGTRAFYQVIGNSMPFGFGNMLGKEGYRCLAYHNHTYSYYKRDQSHPVLGYEYYGLGNGLDVTEVWPESDLEMMQKTVSQYVNEDLFHVYYMTVSGHMNYTFMGNTMAARHKEDVAHLPYSDNVRAYIACQMELDLAVKYLVDELEKAGKLDDTVIVLSGDHYPYGLTHEEIEELHGGSVEENFELYRSTLIIWNPEMETQQVDKYCSAIDIMPTLANLFGLDYDSRLTMGRDIFSDASPLVIFGNRSYITEYGRYNSNTDTFTPNDGVSVPDGYARSILEIVNQKFEYSRKILENDYYSILFPNQ